MIPVKLSLSGFLSYRQPVELDFTTFELACISGANGAGKSSILDGITWALFGKTRSKDDSFINGLSDKAQVAFEFEYENVLYRIQRIKERGKTNILEFQARGIDDQWVPLTEHTYSETQQRIQQTLNMDYETFVNASFFLQGKADSFAQQNPTARKQILSNVLGLEVWETYKKAAAESRASLEKEVSAIDLNMVDIDRELGEAESRKLQLADVRLQLLQAENRRQKMEAAFDAVRQRAAALVEQKRLLDGMAQELQTEERKLADQQRYYDERKGRSLALQSQLEQANQIEERYRCWQAMKADLESFDKLAANFREVEVRRNVPQVTIAKEASKLQQELTHLKEQRADLQDGFAQLPAIDERLAELGSKLNATLKQLSQGSELDKHLQLLRESRAAREAENNAVKEEAERIKKRHAGLTEATEAFCPLCAQPLPISERERLQDSLLEQLEQFREQYRQNNKSIDQLKAEIISGELDLNNIKQLEAEYVNLEKSINSLEDQRQRIVSAQETWIEHSGKRLEAIEKALTDESYALDARQELEAIDREAAALGYDSAAHDSLRQAELTERACEAEWLDLQKAGASLEALSHELTHLELQLTERMADVQRRSAGYQEASAKYEQDAAGQPDLNAQEQELMEVRSNENQLRTSVGHYQQRVDVLEVVSERKKTLTTQRETLTQKIGQYKQLERAFGKDGVPALLIEQALPEIQDQTNAILSLLTDGGMHVTYETQKQYKDKKRADRKETLEIMISDPSGKQREYELYSGGEMFRVNFATRLALSRVLAHRAGSKLQTLVIDEGFGSQDADGRQRLLEAINLVRKDFEKVLVITHLEELKDAFPARIEVEKTPEGSGIKVWVA